jgi:hypothetical protein
MIYCEHIPAVRYVRSHISTYVSIIVSPGKEKGRQRHRRPFPGSFFRASALYGFPNMRRIAFTPQHMVKMPLSTDAGTARSLNVICHCVDRVKIRGDIQATEFLNGSLVALWFPTPGHKPFFRSPGRHARRLGAVSRVFQKSRKKEMKNE